MDVDWLNWDGMDPRVETAAKEAGLNPDDLWSHLEGQHGWESHDEGYERAIQDAVECAVASREAGASPASCRAA